MPFIDLSDSRVQALIFKDIEETGLWYPDETVLSEPVQLALTMSEPGKEDCEKIAAELYPGGITPENFQGAQVKAAGLTQLLSKAKDEAKKGRFSRGFTLAGLDVEGRLGLSDFECDYAMRLAGCRIEGGINLYFARIHAFSLLASVCGEIDARGVTVTGDFALTGVRLSKGAFVEDALVEGKVIVTHACLNKADPDQVISERISGRESRGAIAFSLDGSTIRDDVFLDDLQVLGALVLEHTTIKSGLIIRGAEVKGKGDVVSDPKRGIKRLRGFALTALNAKISGGVVFSDSVFAGEVRMMSMVTEGTVYFSNVTVDGANGRSLLFDFADIQGDLRFRGVTATGCIRMRKAQILGDLVFSRGAGGRADDPACNIQSRYTSFDENQASIDAFERIKGYAMRLSGAVIGGNLRIIGSPERKVCFGGTLDFNNVSVGRKFRMTGCEVKHKAEEHSALRAQFMKIGGDVRWAGVTITGTVDLQDAEVSGSFAIVPYTDGEGDDDQRDNGNVSGRVAPSTIDGKRGEAMLLRRIIVGGDFRIDGQVSKDNSDGAFDICGTILLTGAHVGGELILAAGTCRVGTAQDNEIDHMGVAFGARAAVIERGLYIERDFKAIGEMRLNDAQINGDLRIAKASLSISAEHVREHPFALRLERTKVEGSLYIGGYGGERDRALTVGDDWKQAPRFTCRGPISMTGAQITSSVRIDATHVTSLRREVEAGTLGCEAIGHHELITQMVALRADLITIGKGLYFGSRLEVPTFLDGTFLLNGSDVAGRVEMSGLIVHDPSPKRGSHKGAILAENVTVQSNFDLSKCVILGGVVLTQIEVSGTCHIEETLIASTAAIRKSESKPDASEALIRPDMNPDGTALSMLAGQFGRSLKIRHSVQVFGALNMTAAQISNDLEIWLKTLRKASGLADELAHVLDRESAYGKALNLQTVKVCGSQPETIPDFWGERARVGGVFYLGFLADQTEPDNAGDGGADDSPSDQDLGGRLNFTDMVVNTLKDSPRSWPEQGNLILNGFIYDRLFIDHDRDASKLFLDDDGKAAPWTAERRLEWLKLALSATKQYQDAGYSPRLLYNQLSTVFRRMGLTRDAERVDAENYNRRLFHQDFGPSSRNWVWRLLSRALFLLSLPARAMIWFFYGVGTYYGYRPWRVFFILVPWFLLGFWLSYSAYYSQTKNGDGETEKTVTIDNFTYKVRASCMVPADEGFYFNFMFRARQRIAEINEEIEKKNNEQREALEAERTFLERLETPQSQEYIVVDGFPRPNLFLFTLDSIVPLDLGVDRYWRMSDTEEFCRPAQLQVGTVTITAEIFGYPLSFRVLHFLFKIVGYVLVTVLIAAASGLIRPNVLTVSPQSRSDT